MMPFKKICWINLNLYRNIVDEAEEIEKLDIYEQVKFRIKEFEEELAESLNASSEQKVFNLLQREIDPVMDTYSETVCSLKEKVHGIPKKGKF